MSVDGDAIDYIARDATSQNTLTVIVTADRVRFRDPTVDGGIDPGQACETGEVDSDGFIVEVLCRRAGIGRLRIDVADREDSVTIREAAGVAPLPALVLGGVGADTLLGGSAADQLDGDRVPATSSEVAELAASGTVQVGGQRLAFSAARAAVKVPGGGATLRLRMAGSSWRTLRRALLRGRSLSAVVTVIATDTAGNSSATRLPRIRLGR